MNTTILRRPRRAIGPIVGSALLATACLATSSGCNKKTEAAPAAGPVPVNVGVPVVRDVQNYEEADGRTVARYENKLMARVSGYLEQINFEDGAEVKVDPKKPLFVIDPRPFKAALDAATANVALAKASQAFRKAEHERNIELIKTNAVSRSEFDKSAAALLQSDALIAESEAKAESARLDYEFTSVFAPIEGMLSDTKVDKGNLVVKDQTLLTTIVSVDPMSVEFSVDEQRVQRIRELVRQGKIEVAEQGKIPVEMGLGNGTDFPHTGKIDFYDNQVNPNTGTIRMRAEFPNPQPAIGRRVLMPQMRARVRVPIGKPQKAVLVAEQAIGSDQGQKFVYVVDDKNEVQYRRVTVGKVDGGLRVIEAGLKADEKIIVAGLQRVRPGSAVTAKTVDMSSFATPEGAKAPTRSAEVKVSGTDSEAGDSPAAPATGAPASGAPANSAPAGGAAPTKP
jgi:RND family efflux transporter MFP subunit